MKTFSRLSLFTLVCFGFALMFFGNTSDVHAQDPNTVALEVSSADKRYNVNEEVSITFSVQIDASFPDSPITLTIRSSGHVSGLDPTVSTGTFGQATVTGIAVRSGIGAWIEAVWQIGETEKSVRATFDIDDIGKSPALIVVGSPENFRNPDDELTEVKTIGTTFEQSISIENRGIWSTLDLTAWQMDVVFNPLILEIVKVGDETEKDDYMIEFGDALGADASPMKVSNDMVSDGRISVSQSRAGLTPSGIAIVPGPANSKTLLTITFRVLAVAEEALGIHNVQLQSNEDDNGDGTLDRISYSILVSDVFVATHTSPVPEDVNQDMVVDIKDIVIVAQNIGVSPPNPRADVNADGFVNVLDIVTIYLSGHWGDSQTPQEVNEDNDPALTAPSVSRNVDPAMIQAWIDLAQVADDGSILFDQGIANLQALLASRIPNKTRLLLNYPNPFNPETWIPYQLAKASDVTVMIHSMNGSLIRTLELGHQAAGIYKSKSHAAYWDGRNELGEHVASGLYFYTLTAGKFSATGKMLVRK